MFTPMAHHRPSLSVRSSSNDSAISPLTTSAPSATSASRRPAHLRRNSAGDVGFEQTRLAEYLGLDARPTFVVAHAPAKNDVQPVFVNPALQKSGTLLSVIRDALRKVKDNAEFLAFVQVRDDLQNTTLRWKGRSWRRVLLASGWVVVHCESTKEPNGDTSERTLRKKNAAVAQEDKRALVDWTRESVPSPTQWVQFLRAYDWASTALGPMEEWSWDLRTWVHTLTADPSPAIVLWGEQKTILYNQECKEIIGEKHPGALGGHPSSAFGELWPHTEDMIERVRTTGKTIEQHNLCLPLQRRGIVEETFWTFAIMPILGPDGRVLGVYDRFIETTSFNIAERRQMTLARIGEFGRRSNDLPDLWQQVLSAIDINTQTPFAVIYSVQVSEELEDDRSTTSTLSSSRTLRACKLEGMIGVPDNYRGVPTKLDLTDGDEEIIPFMRQAWRSNEPILMSRSEGTLPAAFCIRNPTRGYAEECTGAVVVPIRFALEHSITAFLVHGLNPRRPYDADYQGYITLMQTRIVELAANIFLPEEDRRTQAILREETLRQASLASRLLSKTHEAEQKQMRFMRLAQNAPIGMVMYDGEGKPLFCNDAYFDLLGQSRETFTPATWLDTIHEDDRAMVQREWKKLIEDGIPVTIEHRVGKPWKSVDPVDGSEVIGETWLLSSAFPEITGVDQSGPSQIMGWLIDISHQKWAEKLQRQRLEDALENKRQSENFIDMTSHEMRNPLSAILQSADGINTAIGAALADTSDPAAAEDLHSIAENARTIVLCAQHQKRIVDDILTLSKLDSNLLLITPEAASPLAIVRHVLKMYEAELLNSDIEVNVSIDPRYKALGIRHVLLDPSRLLQVLINLLTNAIKFTQFQKHRSITIFLSASRKKPTHGPNGAKFFPTYANRSKAPVANSTHYEKDPVYLMFAVSDSGRGLSEPEHKMLFHRFSQANPRTHVQYGGSGLGLFISRELTELQGGQIGVHSALGEGSTFAFYITSYKCTAAHSDSEEGADNVGAQRKSVSKTSLPFTTSSRPVSTLERATSSPAAPMTTPHSTFDQLTSISEPTQKRISIEAGKVLHVLVVEDNVINQRVMAKQLQRAGCVVHVANHGGEALEFLWRSKLVVLERSDSGCDVSPDGVAGAAKAGDAPTSASTTASTSDKPSLDVILMDLEMPVMDGLSCVREIRTLQRTRKIGRHVPIICITANAREAQIEEAKRVGCDMVVTKPFRIPELLPQMHDLVEEWRAASEGNGSAKAADTNANANAKVKAVTSPTRATTK